jgi:hypothetical protein
MFLKTLASKEGINGPGAISKEIDSKAALTEKIPSGSNFQRQLSTRLHYNIFDFRQRSKTIA